ncbi:MAG: hypothetical protein ACYTJ0_05345 [Planctomycetota bacterium]|jgi:tetratricopeptide (TPR) repeat protein
MPGRFSRLEFDHEHGRERAEEHRALEEGTPVRTAGHYAELAEHACRRGRFESALQHYTRCVREDRTAIPAWVGQVQMLVQLGEYAEARLWADKSLELFRNNGDLLAAKAQAALRDGDRATALAASDASLKAPGSSPWRWEVRGEVLLARGARLYRDCFQKALAEPAADWFDRVVIARILLFHGRAAAALDHAQQAVQRRPAHAYNWLVLAECQSVMGWRSPAEASCRRCLELEPDLHEARVALEAILRQRSLTGLLRRLRRWRRR